MEVYLAISTIRTTKLDLMDVIEKFGSEIRTLNQFVAELDPAVRAEAFKFLLSRQFRQDRFCNKSLEEPVDEIGAADALQFGRKFAPQELLRRVGASATSE